jgi:nucleoside-diphosphate-sugar epimerase
MVIGNGLIAQAFKKYTDNENILMFASGTSSSKFCTPYDCLREESLLTEFLDKYSNQVLFVYFSSCSIANSNLTYDAYHSHKKKMEGIIRTNAKKYTIFRLPNVVGPVVNLDTLFYYLVDKVLKKKEFDLWSGAKRNIIDIDDVAKIINHIVDNNLFLNETVNVANLNDVTVDEIVNEISKYLGIDGKFTIVEYNDNYYIDLIKIKPIVRELGMNFNLNYLQIITKKYIATRNVNK